MMYNIIYIAMIFMRIQDIADGDDTLNIIYMYYYNNARDLKLI